MVQVASLLSVLSVLQKRYARWLARWRARSATNFKLRLAMLLGFGVMITVLGAALYRWSNPEEDWSSSLFTVYAVLYSIPGADITNNPSLLATFVLNLIFIFGLLVFATILAMITDEINNVMLAARSGKSPVALSGHILLLNWNQQVPFILDQLEQIQLRGGAHPFANRPLVILADKDKEELDAQVLGLLKHGQLEVHTRSGKPYRLEHLARAAAADAFAVLLMHPEASAGDDEGSEAGEGSGEDGGGGDEASVSVVGAAAQGDSGGAAALKLQTIMALTSLQAGKKVALVVQAPDDSNIGLQELDQVLLRAGHPANLMNLPVRKMVNSLAVQTTLQPWSASIYHSILQQGLQPSLTFTKVPETLFLLKSELADRTVSFEEARTAVASDMLTVGYVSGTDGQLFLNPPEGSRLSPGDTLVALTTQDKVAASGVKLPLSQRIQAAAIKTALTVQNSPVVSKLRSLTTPRPAAAAAAATLPAEAAADSASSSSSSRGSSKAVMKDAPKSGSSLAAIEESQGSVQQDKSEPLPNGSTVGLSSTPAAAAAAAAETAAVAGAAAAGAAARGSPKAQIAGSNSAAAAAGSSHDFAPPQTPEPSARLSTAAAPATDSSGSAKGVSTPAAVAAAGVGGTTAATAAAAAAAAASGSASRPVSPDSDVAAAADVPTVSATPAAAAAADATSAQKGLEQSHTVTQKEVQHKKHKQKKKAPLFMLPCCFTPVADDEDDGLADASSGGSRKAPALGSTTKSTTFKVGKMDIGKTVTGAVTSVGKGVTSVGKGVTSAVTTVADGAVGVTKTVVTGAVNTVTDGAALVGKAVTTVADGAVDLSKTVATGAVGAVTGGAGLVTKTVTSAVKAPSMLLKSDSSIIRNSGSKAPGGLLGAPTGWLFGGAKQKQTLAKSAAFGRLANVDMAAARAPPAKPLRIVVAGFTADEAASELLPHFLDFAPANSTVTFVVKESSPPEGFEARGTIEEDEEREGAEPLHHCVHYTFMPASSPTSGAALSEAGLLQADAVLLAAEESLRSSPAEADAAVLSSLVSIQHILASKGAAVALSHSRSLAGKSSASSSSAAAAQGGLLGAGSIFSSAVGSVTKGAASVTKGAANLTFKAAATAVSAAKTLTMVPVRDDHSVTDQAQQGSGRAEPKVPHVVACVSTTSSKAVAAAFFGPPAAGRAASGGLSASATVVGSEAVTGMDVVAGGVVRSRLFTYELLVPGEIEGSVLVQVANEPLYVKVVHEMLVTSEGCELYLLTPSAFGFFEDEELAFAEVQEVGRLLRRTAIGVVSDGRIQLAPDTNWRWKVKGNDRIAAIADSW